MQKIKLEKEIKTNPQWNQSILRREFNKLFLDAAENIIYTTTSYEIDKQGKKLRNHYCSTWYKHIIHNLIGDFEKKIKKLKKIEKEIVKSNL